MPQLNRKDFLEACLKGILAAVDTTWWLKVPGVVIAEISSKVEDLPPDQQDALSSATPKQIEDVLSQLDLTSQNAALSAGGLVRVEEQLGWLIGWAKKHEEKGEFERQAIAQQKLALHEKEGAAFSLGRLCFLLVVLETGHRVGEVSKESLDQTRTKTIDYLTRFREMDSRFVSSANAMEIMHVAHEAVSNHVGRVENAHTLGGLIQVFELNSNKDNNSSYGEQLKLIAKDKRKVWTPDAILLPENVDLRAAARTIFEYAEKGRCTPKDETQNLLRILSSCYVP